MALKSTIFKVELSIADMDRHYYHDHQLTIARHPSETDERMMFRLLAFALNASEFLEFTKGLSTDDEPDIWSKNLTDEIELWIDLGQPDEKRIRRACGKAKQVLIYCYSGHGAEIWWSQAKGKLKRFDNLGVINFPADVAGNLSAMVQRTMKLACNIQDEQLLLSNHENMVEIKPVRWK